MPGKQLPLLFLVFLCIPCFPQSKTINGRVIDSETGAPVRYAQVHFAGTFCGTATNRNGEFSLNATACPGKDLIISAAPYESASVKINNQKSSFIEVSLLPRALRKTFRPGTSQVCSIIEKLIHDYSLNHEHPLYTSTTFHREYIQSFNNIIQVSEGVLQTTKRQDVTETRVKDYLFAEDKGQREHFWNPAIGGFYTFGWQPMPPKSVIAKNFFLGLHLKTASDPFKYYDFTCTGSLSYPTGTLYIIKFDQKDQIRASLLRGTMYVDSASHGLARVEYELSPKGMHHIMPNRMIGGIRICKSPMKVEILRESGVSNYQRIGKRWYLSNQITDTEFNASLDTLEKSSRQPHYLKIHSEFILSKVDTSMQQTNVSEPVRNTVISRDYLKRNFENYQSSKAGWDNDISMKADTSVSDVIRTLRVNNQHWEKKESRKAMERLKMSTELTSAQSKEDVSYLQKNLVELHPLLADAEKRNEFTRSIEKLDGRLERTITEKEFAQLLAPIIGSIECSHTRLIPSARTEEYNQRFGKYFPFEISVMGRRAFLSGNVADSARGAEILSINGTPMQSVLHSLHNRAFTEGDSEDAKDYSLGKHFAPLYNSNFVQTDSFALALKNYKTRQTNTYTFAAANFNVYSSGEHDILRVADSIQTMVISPPEHLSDHEFSSLLSSAFKLVRKSGHTNVVLDLRDNGRFKESFAPVLLSHLSGSPQKYFHRITPASKDHAAYNVLRVGRRPFNEAAAHFRSNITRSDSTPYLKAHPMLNPIIPSSSPYAGNLFILVNGGTSSAGVDLAKFLQTHKRAVIVGQELDASFHGSCDLGETTLILPQSGLRISLPLASYHLDTPLRETRLVPDHLVHYGVSDIVDNRDLEMEVCRNLIIGICCTARSE